MIRSTNSSYFNYHDSDPSLLSSKSFALLWLYLLETAPWFPGKAVVNTDSVTAFPLSHSLLHLLFIPINSSLMCFVKFHSCIGCCSVANRVQLFATPWTAAPQAFLPLTTSQSSPKFVYSCIGWDGKSILVTPTRPNLKAHVLTIYVHVGKKHEALDLKGKHLELTVPCLTYLYMCKSEPFKCYNFEWNVHFKNNLWRITGRWQGHFYVLA